MKICFNARPAYDKASSLIFKELNGRDSDIKGTFVVCTKKDAMVVQSNVTNPDLRYMPGFIKEHWNEASRGKLSEYEKKFDASPVWKYIYMDRFLVNRSYEEIIGFVCGMFGFYDSIFSIGDYNIYFDETIATAQSYIAYLVAKHYGVKYVALMAARGADTTNFYVVTEPLQYQYGFDEDYKTKTYSEDICQKAEEIYNRYFDNYDKPKSMALVQSKPKLNLRQLARSVKMYFDKSCHDKYDLINYRAYRREFSQFMFFFKYIRCKKFYLNKVPDEKYVYFPLHYQPEASTLVCAPKYEKQIFYIDSWAKSLPADTVLFVKEHYALVGHRPYDFYKQLKKYPNVRMLSPWVPSVSLIKGAQAITTLTGTAGWEAMILGKPVYIGGSIYFDNAPGVYKIDEAFGAYREENKGAAKEDILQYLCEYISNIYPGGIYFTSSKYLNNENISLICDTLIKIFNEMGEKKNG